MAGDVESENALVRYKARQFTEIITGARTITEFDVDLYFAITEKIVVDGGGRLVVVLLDGTEVECEME